MKDKGMFTVMMISIVVLIFLGGLVCGINLEHDLMEEQAVKKKVAEYYIDENNSKSFRFLSKERICKNKEKE